MPIAYSLSVKTARMDAVRRMLDGGALQIYDAQGNIIFSSQLGSPCGIAIGSILRIAVQPSLAIAAGRIAGARIVDSNNNPAVSGFSIGLSKDRDIVLTRTVTGTLDVSFGDLLQLQEFDLIHS
jgi:hypothetical protein